MLHFQTDDFFKTKTCGKQEETLAQIFTDIRYTKADNEAMSEGLKEALKAQGFF
jgi:hypothetical protein